MLDFNKYIELRAAVMTSTEYNKLVYECSILKLVCTFIQNCNRFPSYVKMKDHGNIQSREIYKIINNHPTGDNLHIHSHWYTNMNDIEIIQATVFIKNLIIIKKMLIRQYKRNSM